MYNRKQPAWAKPLPSYEVLHELFTYDESTGEVWRKIDTPHGGKKGAYAGDLVGQSINSGGYRLVMVNKVSYVLARVVWKMYYGVDPVNWIDHINRVTHDNRIANLRDVTRSVNNKNCALRAHNTSGFTGVTHRKSRGIYSAYIDNNKRRIWLGDFLTADQAFMERAYYVACSN